MILASIQTLEIRFSMRLKFDIDYFAEISPLLYIVVVGGGLFACLVIFETKANFIASVFFGLKSSCGCYLYEYRKATNQIKPTRWTHLSYVALRFI